MSLEDATNPVNLGLGRRKFVKTLAVLAGLTVTAEALAACGDTATAVPATTVAAAATTAPAATTTTAATTAATTTAAVPATTAAVATTATTTTASTGATTTAAGASSGTAGYVKIGAASDYKADADPVAFTVNNVKGYVYNKGGDYYVFSNICTHRGCPVPYVATDQKFECPCHGSQYDKTGEVLKGPAPKRLLRYDAKVNGSDLVANIS